MMTLESAIKHCEEVAEEQEKLCKVNDSFNFSQPKWGECAAEHRQLAEWLKDYKRLKEQEPFKNAYIQVVKERDIAIGQLNELGYSLGEKIEPCEKEQEPTIDEVIAEIDKQGEWLEEAGYNAYNVDIAFGSIIRALRKWLTPHR
jgi:hypothetical protein